MTKETEQSRRPRGRPETRVIKLDATPEEVARAIFSAVKPPDPSLRRIGKGRRRKEASARVADYGDE